MHRSYLLFWTTFGSNWFWALFYVNFQHALRRVTAQTQIFSCWIVVTFLLLQPDLLSLMGTQTFSKFDVNIEGVLQPTKIQYCVYVFFLPLFAIIHDAELKAAVTAFIVPMKYEISISQRKSRDCWAGPLARHYHLNRCLTSTILS